MAGSPSTASLTDDSTARDQHCPTSSGPASPAAWTAKRSASTSRTPASAGSTPSRAQASSQKDRPGTISSSIEGSDAEQLDGPLGNRRRPRHPVGDPAVLGRRRPQLLDDRGVHLVEVRARLVAVVESHHVGKLEKRAGRRVPCRPQERHGSRPERVGGRRRGVLGPGRPEAGGDDGRTLR